MRASWLGLSIPSATTGRPSVRDLATYAAKEAIAPDLGERYLDTIYRAEWVRDMYGEEVLGSDEPISASPVRPSTAPVRVRPRPSRSRRTNGGRPTPASPSGVPTRPAAA